MGPPRPTWRRSRWAAWERRARSATSWRSSAPTAARTSPARRSPSTAACSAPCSRTLMRKLFTPGRLLLAGAILALVTFGVLWLAPSDDYLLLPDEAHPVAPLVTVETPKRGGGQDGVYFVDLIQKRASLLESIFPSIRGGSTLVPRIAGEPAGDRRVRAPPGRSGQMARSQEIAAAVALRELGYDVQSTRERRLRRQRLQRPARRSARSCPGR